MFPKDEKTEKMAADIHQQYLDRKDTVAPKFKHENNCPFTIRKIEKPCCKGEGDCDGSCEECLELETLEGENDYVQRNL
jgi:hypothetical protein